MLSKKNSFVLFSALFSVIFSFSTTYALDSEAAAKATQAASEKDGHILPTKPPFSVKKLLEHIQTYLNNLTSFHARFRQEDPDGTIRTGDIYIQKPGKMRLEYKTPGRLLVISDGTWISYDDKELDQISYVPFSSTPAALILKEKFSFQDLFVDKVEYSPEGELLLTVRDKADPSAGTLVLIFKEAPLSISGWQLIDQSTQTTVVKLYDIISPTEAPAGSFEISDPTRR